MFVVTCYNNYHRHQSISQLHYCSRRLRIIQIKDFMRTFGTINTIMKRPRPLIGFQQGDNITDMSDYGRVSDYNVRGIQGPRHFDPHAPAPIHRGKGPKSYRRSDDRIFEDICRRMSDNQYLDASDIEVSGSGRSCPYRYRR